MSARGKLLRAARFQNLFCFGNSLTAGSGSTGGSTYPQQLVNSWTPARWYYNGGVGGETSSQILTRYLAADAGYKAGTLLIEAGRNNYSSPTQVKADIAAMVAEHEANGGGGRYLVGSIPNGEYPNEHLGQSNYNTIIQLDADLLATYGTRYVDFRSALVAAYNPANTMDVADFAADVPPFTVRANNVNGTLTVGINASVTTFTTDASFSGSYVLQIDSEYILVSTVAGTTISTCVRGYGGSTAASHLNGAAIAGTDPIHYNNSGYAVMAQAYYAKIAAFGW